MLRTASIAGYTRRDAALVLSSRWRVEAGFLLGGVGLSFSRPTVTSIVLCMPLVVAGLALRTWARGHLERRSQLTESGPYALMRHPLYVGTFLIGMAFALMARVPALPPLFALVFVGMYLPKALREEAFLRQRYGSQHLRYGARVAAFTPRWRSLHARPRPDASGRFAWRRVFHHREYETWLGVAALLGIMTAYASGYPLLDYAVSFVRA